MPAQALLALLLKSALQAPPTELHLAPMSQTLMLMVLILVSMLKLTWVLE